MIKKISGVYKITNTVTGDFYIGSSNNVKRRWEEHKCPSALKRFPNNPMYLEMQKYGTDKFDFQILAEVEIEHLKETEQKLIELLKPIYNDRNANGWDIERQKEHQIEYRQQNRENKKNMIKNIISRIVKTKKNIITNLVVTTVKP